MYSGSTMAVSKMCFSFSLFTVIFWVSLSSINGALPPSCKSIECPSYATIHEGDGFEIRRYNFSLWVSTSPIQDVSFVSATRTGFLELFDYIQGKNKYGTKIEMTAPVMTEVFPSSGPFCASEFVVSFYVPGANQADPPPAQGLQAQKWVKKFAAVRQFGGFVSDYNIGQEASKLHASLLGSKWSTAIAKSKSHDDKPDVFTVAQYNSPFEFSGRVNEIWLLFDMQDVSMHIKVTI
ncbi:heme-binding protein 2 [Amborella trichopoda]|nr:heme-binding protein 2 [Amborella trichopoda]|eukprot:XP_006856039.2 heme-binding protein 2 [Amborella trichopoda]